MEDSSKPTGLTEQLLDSDAGNRAAFDAMVPEVYKKLRHLAIQYMRRERPDHTLQPTALVHEVYLRLIDQRVDWRNRALFFSVASAMMRRVLVNHARDRSADKRGGGAEKVSLHLGVSSFAQPEVDLVALDKALDQLAALDQRKSRIVELKFFGGLTTAEIAEVLQISIATVERDWSFARAWLYDAISGVGSQT